MNIKISIHHGHAIRVRPIDTISVEDVYMIGDQEDDIRIKIKTDQNEIVLQMDRKEFGSFKDMINTW